MKTNVTAQTVTKPKMNLFIKAGALFAALSLIIPVILTTVVLPIIPQYASEIFGTSIALSYVTAISAGSIVFGAFQQRYFAK